MNKDLFFIRDAKSELNALSKDPANPILCGSTDAHILDPKNVKEEFARKILINNDFKDALNTVDHIYVSSLIRTRETAECLLKNKEAADGNDPAPVKLIPCDELNEIDFGDYEKALKNSLPENVLDFWLNEPEKTTFPGGDNILQRTDQTFEWLQRIIKEDKGPIIIVSSSTILRLVISRMLGYPLVFHNKIEYPNCHVLQFRYNEHTGKFCNV